MLYSYITNFIRQGQHSTTQKYTGVPVHKNTDES